ncbi:MAG: hypothetical protein LLF94_03310 [Chlamydiales bacterium]|nr:hypothetical protein [Chlamydiales bacterium]
MEYSRIMEKWANSKNKPEVEKKLEELKSLVKRTLRADPEKGVTIEIALKTRNLQQKQITMLTDLLSRPATENTEQNTQNIQFFNGKVRHPTQKNLNLYLKIVQQATTKHPYKQLQIIKLLKAYESFVKNPKDTIAEEAYTSQKEAEFLERILTALLQTTRFDIEFDWIKKALTLGEKEKYSITASKIMTKVNNAIEGKTIDQCMKKGFTAEDFNKITTVDYVKLENMTKAFKK